MAELFDAVDGVECFLARDTTPLQDRSRRGAVQREEERLRGVVPLTVRRLDFGQCAITPDPERGTFGAVLNVPGPVVDGLRPDRFPGRWRVRHGLVATAVVIRAPTSARAG